MERPVDQLTKFHIYDTKDVPLMMNQLESFAAVLAEKTFNARHYRLYQHSLFYFMCMSFTSIQSVYYVEIINQNSVLSLEYKFLQDRELQLGNYTRGCGYP